MVHKKTKLIIALLMVVTCSLISLQGCSFLRKLQTPIEEKGLSIGFQYENSQGSLITAVKSDKKVFDIDDVTLDFYYGGIASHTYYNSVALYFISGRNNYFIEVAVDDYKDIEGCIFIKEMTIDEFESEPFDIEIRWSPKKKDKKDEAYFHYVDTLTVPEEVFSEQTGYFYFIVALIRENKENNLTEVYNSGRASGQIIRYIKNDDGTVELKKG